jgi:hypothetical protein
MSTMIKQSITFAKIIKDESKKKKEVYKNMDIVKINGIIEVN